jgi:hypothetical protein
VFLYQKALPFPIYKGMEGEIMDPLPYECMSYIYFYLKKYIFGGNEGDGVRCGGTLIRQMPSGFVLGIDLGATGLNIDPSLVAVYALCLLIRKARHE